MSGRSAHSSSSSSSGELDRKVDDFVRYMLFVDSKKNPVKRADLNKHVLKEHTKSFSAVFAAAQKKMKEIFGYELIEANHKQTKVYFLINNMQDEANQVCYSNPFDQPKMGLLLIILATIFMKDNVVTEEILWDTLKILGVIKGEVHCKFGDVEKLITSEYVQQMYLNRNKIVTDGVARYEYAWGLRAEKEVSKRKVLEFVAQVYGTDVEMWTAKLKEVAKEEEEREPDSD